MNVEIFTVDSTEIKATFFPTDNIRGEDLGVQNIRIKYYRDEDGNIRNTLAYREVEGRIYFGIASYNPSDRKLKVQPSRKIGRQEAVFRLYMAEQDFFMEDASFFADSSGRLGCCDTEEFDFLDAWTAVR